MHSLQRNLMQLELAVLFPCSETFLNLTIRKMLRTPTHEQTLNLAIRVSGSAIYNKLQDTARSSRAPCTIVLNSYTATSGCET